MSARALLRSLPAFAADEIDLINAYQLKLVQATFRAAATAWVHSRFGASIGTVGYAARSLARSTEVFGESLQGEASGHLADAAHSTLSTITSHQRALNDASDAIEDSFRAAAAALRQQGTRRDTFEAFAFDCGVIESGTGPDELAAMPLWPDGLMPQWCADLWRQLSAFLDMLNEDWDVWTTWYAARLRGDPGAEKLEDARLRNVTEEEWNGEVKIANAKIRAILQSLQADTWISALDDSKETDAPPITVKNDQLQFSSAKDTDDRAVAGRSSMKEEYEHIRQLAREIQKKVTTWVNEDCHPDWHGLKPDINRLVRLLGPDLDSAVDQIGVLWAAGVSVAEYLDQDRQLRTNSTSGNAPALPLPIRNSLNVFAQVYGGWLLEFPTVARREENAHSFRGAIERLETAKTVVAEVRSSNVLKRGDLELLEELLRTASRTGPQATKARFWSFATLRRLLLASGKILAQGVAGHVVGEVAESSVLLDRLTKLFVQGEAAVTEFIVDLPTSSREALLALIDQLRDN